MKVRLLTSILYEYGGMRKTLWKAGMVLSAKPSLVDELPGYWITTGERTPVPPGYENPGALYETKCFPHECEVVDE